LHAIAAVGQSFYNPAMADAPEVEQGGPPDEQAATAFPLLAHLDGLVEDLRGRIPAALGQWDSEAIHQSRVATRRMKAALDLMRPVLGRRGRRRFGRMMRNLRRRLGPLRDVDVMIDHLREVGDEGKYRRAVEWLSQRLCREREALRLASAKRRPAEAILERLAAWEPVRHELAAAHEAVDTLLAESLHLQLDMFAEQADRLVPATESGAQDVVPASSAVRQDPHELRISGKALRYTLEMAAVQGHELPGSLTKTFKKMQDALGLWHDYVVLAERSARAGLDDQLAHHEPELMTELLELVRDVLGRATHHLGKFKRQWTEEGDAVAKAIRTSFPLTHPAPAAGDGAPADVTGSQTDPGRRGSGSPEGPEGCPPAAASDA
jgi:CHAD domain-containing protein